MSFESVGADGQSGDMVSEIVRTEISSIKPLPYTVLERMMLDGGQGA